VDGGGVSIPEATAHPADKLVPSEWEMVIVGGKAMNSLWPRTPIVTTAIPHPAIVGEDRGASARAVDIMADAARAILTRDSRSGTGNFCFDDAVLRKDGVTDFAQYRTAEREEDMRLDLYVSERLITS
jgi:citronellol/citronellal dehydrogenase